MRVLHRLIFVAAAVLAAAGCKQGLGDRCQVNDDCESAACSTGTNRVCTNPNTEVKVDAAVAADARVDAGGLFPDANRPADAAQALDAPAVAPDAPPVVPDAPLSMPDAP